MKKFTFKQLALFVVADFLLAVAIVYFFFPQAVLALGMQLERGRSGLQERQAQVDEHRVVYLDNGKVERPTVVLVHGFSGDKDNWTRMAPYLRDQFRVIALDLPGFGQSTRQAESSYDVTAQVGRLHRFLNDLDLDRVHIAGNSMGGHIAAVYAATFTEEVLSLGLFANGGVTTAAKSEMARLRERGINPLLVHNRQEFEAMLDFVFVQRPFVPGPVLEYFAEQAIKNRAFNQKIFSDLTAKPQPLEPLLAKIRAPVFIIWGDHDRLLDVSAVQIMLPLLSDARKVTILSDCGHLPMLEQAEASGRDYVRFLTGL